MSVDREAAARAIDDFLRALGHDPARAPDLQGTGRRVADAWADDLLGGERVDVPALLAAESFPLAPGPSARSLVLLRDRPLATMCPHHLLPALGSATLVYAPGARVAGLGALGQLLEAFARRLTLQERIGEEVVSALMSGLGAEGAACSLRLRHACLSARGSREPSWVETLAFAGSLSPGGPHGAALFSLLGQAP